MNKVAPQSAEVDLRLTAEQQAILERAALACRQTVSQFVLGSALSAAEQMLLSMDFEPGRAAKLYRPAEFD